MWVGGLPSALASCPGRGGHLLSRQAMLGTNDVPSTKLSMLIAMKNSRESIPFSSARL